VEHRRLVERAFESVPECHARPLATSAAMLSISLTVTP
jgi:hypothetical protein